jgi:PilZ domain-containing protein
MDYSGQSGEQRRRHRRSAVQLVARVLVGVHDLPAVAENISPGGAFLRVALPGDAEWVLAEIELPEGKQLTVRARVRWRREQPAGVGVQFHSFSRRPEL